METTIHINNRGTLTLPKALRQSLGVPRGGNVVVEKCDSGIILRPSVTFPIEMYSDARIKEFDEADKELGDYLRSKRR